MDLQSSDNHRYYPPTRSQHDDTGGRVYPAGQSGGRSHGLRLSERV